MSVIRKGLSADCKLASELVIAIMMEGREHPCDRCIMDRKKCRGYEGVTRESVDEPIALISGGPAETFGIVRKSEEGE